MIKNLSHYLLKNRMKFAGDWTAQGFGFLRLRIDESARLHVWHSCLRTPGVSDIHDHSQWAFTSHVISGHIMNVRYEMLDSLANHYMATLVCGIGGGMVSESEPELVCIHENPAEHYFPGDCYSQEPDEIHRTVPIDGTVTLIHQHRRNVDTARVFWPIGTKWGDAIPRQASRNEVDFIGEFALSLFEK